MARFSIASLLTLAIICGEKMLVSSQEMSTYWRDYRGTVPSDAVSTGHGTYIAQVVLNNCGLVAGTLYPDRRLVVSEGPSGRVEVRSNIKILCSSNPSSLKWEYVNVQQLDPRMLEKCVLGGFEDGSSVYIGKSFHEAQWKIGKVFPPTSPHKGLRIWWNSGQGYAPTDFQILMTA